MENRDEQLAKLLTAYADAEEQEMFSGEPFLFKILVHPSSGLPWSDVGLLALHLQGKSRKANSYREAIRNPMLLQWLGVAGIQAFVNLSESIERYLIHYRSREGNYDNPFANLSDKPRSPSQTLEKPNAILQPLLKMRVATMNLSYSTLSAILRCPLSFYFEKVLRVPFVKHPAAHFGIAVHEALAMSTTTAGQPSFAPLQILLANFATSLRKHSSQIPSELMHGYGSRGNEALRNYHNLLATNMPVVKGVEWRSGIYKVGGIPITGVLDRIDVSPTGIKVVDYKTGNPSKTASASATGPSTTHPLGGDYWRQMVFYKILLLHHPSRPADMETGTIQYLELAEGMEDLQAIHISPTESDMEVVMSQMRAANQQMQALEFFQTCKSPYCSWCRMNE